MNKIHDSFFKRLDLKESKLSNGIKIITIKRNTELISTHIGIGSGSLTEGENEKGISHFLEHILFKGTSSRTNEELIEALEDLGGEYDAYTDYNSTVFSTTSLSEEIDNSFEILSNLLLKPSIKEKDVKKEKEVILSELRSYYDDIESFSFIKLNYESFNKSPLKHEVIGNKESLKNITREKLIKFHENNYTKDNIYIVVVSNFEHLEVEERLEKYFSVFGGEKVKNKEVIHEKNISKEIVTIKEGFEQCTITYLYTFYGLTEKEELALKILMQKLVSSSNSILFRILREEKGYIYELSSDMDNDKNVKTLYIYTSCSTKNLEETKNIIEKTIENIKNKKIEFDQKSIDIMKKNVLTAIAELVESSEGLGGFFLQNLLNGHEIDKIFRDVYNVDKICTEDIYNVAKKVLSDPSIHILRNE